MSYTHLTSLEALRAEKRSTLKSLRSTSGNLKRRIRNNIAPENNMFLRSDMKYLRYVGYGIVAFKAFNTARRIMNFFTGRR